MTTETSNARGDVVAERQAWYEQQIALAEGQWAAAFLDRWECGDDVPSKEHYVALWLAERAAPPPAGDAEAEALAKYQPCGCVICTCEDEKQCQGCGAKHCGNRTNHPAYVKQQPEAQGGGEVVARGFYDPMTGAYSESQHTPRWLPAVVYAAPPSAPVGVEGLIEAAKAAESMLRTVHECASHECEDCREYAGIVAKKLRAALAQQPAAAGEESSKGADVARPKRRPYNASGSLSEYGVFPECDAQQPAAGAVDKARFRKAPCYLCGYNGPGYYQPDTHPCAAKYHAAQHQEPTT